MKKRVAIFFIAALVSIFGAAACGGGRDGTQQLQEQVDEMQEQLNDLQEQVQEQVDELQGEPTDDAETTVGETTAGEEVSE